jgi:transposase
VINAAMILGPYVGARGARGRTTFSFSASRCRDSYLSGRYHRLAGRRGKQRAIVAVEHSILIAVWHMLTNNVDYHDLGANHFTRRDPGRTLRHITKQANALGFTVRFDPIPLASPAS